MVKETIKSIKRSLFRDPWRLYQEELHLINQPFYFAGDNNKAVLLIHGWTSTPYEVRRLGKYLNESGYTVSGPMLRGHGTVPKDLENVQWTEWLADVEKSYLELQKNHAQVFVGGTSLGANLTVLLARQHPEIAGLILLATPYQFKFEKLVSWLVKFFLKFFRYRKKFYPPTFGAATTITRLIAYQTYPLKNVLQTAALVREFRKSLAAIKQPCFLAQSTHDHMTIKDNMEIIYGKIGSAVKEKRYIKRAYHTFISDIKNEHIFEDILNFLEEN